MIAEDRKPFIQNATVPLVPLVLPKRPLSPDREAIAKQLNVAIAELDRHIEALGYNSGHDARCDRAKLVNALVDLSKTLP